MNDSSFLYIILRGQRTWKAKYVGKVAQRDLGEDEGFFFCKGKANCGLRGVVPWLYQVVYSLPTCFWILGRDIGVVL